MKKKIAKIFKALKKNWFFALFILIVSITAFLFTSQYFERIIISLKSLFNNFIYFLFYDFLKDKTPPEQAIDTLITMGGGTYDFVLPFDWEIIKERFILSFHLFLNGDIWSFYLSDVEIVLHYVCRIISFVCNLAIIIYAISKTKQFEKDSDFGQTKALARWGKIENKLRPTKYKIENWYDLNFNNRSWVKPYLLFLVICGTGLLSILIDTLSEIYLLGTGLHWDYLWKYFVLLFSEVTKFLMNNSALIVFPFVMIVFLFIRKSRAYSKLEKYEEKNYKLVSESGNMLALIGPSGTGKTTIVSYLSTIAERYIRNLTLKIQRRHIILFPKLNYRKIERMVEEKTKRGDFKNRSHIHEFIQKEKRKFEKGEKTFIGDYQGKTKYYDGLSIKNMWSSIYNYAAAYFIYSITTPLAAGNLAIAHDMGMADNYYYPVYDAKPIRRKSSDWKKRKFNKVINYDWFRMGKRVDSSKTKEQVWFPDFGVFVMAEYSKERGSYEEVRSQDRNAVVANQTNDLFPEFHTVMRHGAELDHEVLFKIIVDEQQIMKINPQMRKQIETTLFLDRFSIKRKNTLSFWFIEEMFGDFITNLYFKYEEDRKSKTLKDSLTSHLIKKIFIPIIRRYQRLSNEFGYTEISFYRTNNGMEDVSNKISNGKLYLPHKIVYSEMFDSVHLKNVFMAEMSTRQVSFRELEAYTRTDVGVRNLARQNAYANEKSLGVLGIDETMFREEEKE